MLKLDDFQARPFSAPGEYQGMIDYFVDADDSFLRGMGVERALVPTKQDWLRAVLADHERPDDKKDRLYVGWFYRGSQIGHSSVNRIKVGEEAFFHLHLWRPDLRMAGAGTYLCRESIKIYFDRLRLKRLWCEPYAENPAPNRTLPKLGFDFVKRYHTVPGTINFEQDVNLYCLSKEAFESHDASGSSLRSP